MREIWKYKMWTYSYSMEEHGTEDTARGSGIQITIIRTSTRRPES